MKTSDNDMELTYNQVLELLPAYALGALEPDEMLAVDAYLHQHQDLLVRLNTAEEAAAQLAYAAPAVPLPATAKERLMSRVQADLAGQVAPADGVPQAAPEVRPARPVPPPAPQPGWWAGLRSALASPWWAAATAVALVLLLAGLFYLNQLQGQLSQANSQLSSLEARVTELEVANQQLQQANGSLQQQAQADQQRLLLIANADPGRSLQIAGTEADPDASGAFYVRDNQGVLILEGLEPLPADKTYQLWLIPADRAP